MMDEYDRGKVQEFSEGCRSIQEVCRSYLDEDPQSVRSGIRGPLLPHYR